ncbi:RsiV family protein [Duncaniella sp.]|uniref:RsiV family protein n=1 Tax=Duncaniella sp. TaxID=2518496 RepID=UPI0023CA4E39|nr:RsiV family protein [Duncaniella sp.]MDE5690546.1 RsiV family protein [Duncaniella sp.]MDE5905458.1 RsiV family protein [Duncaniella sp.]
MERKYCFLASAALALALTACGGSGSGRKADAGLINEFQVSEVLMTADRDYRVSMDYGDAYLELYTSIHWPERLGDNDISVLRDSLLYFAYGDTTVTDIRAAIRAYLDDTSIVEGIKTVTEVDSLPADTMTYFNNVTASVMEINEDMATYQVVSSTYLGGAHPMTSVRPFTYSFAQGQVIGLDNMFLPGVTVDSIMPVIRTALARQLSVPVDALDRGGIFVSQLTYPGKPYIASNTLYFHYDPYEIGPYALGPVDVAVYPDEVDRFLRPDVKSLFDQGF